ncbi:MAG: SIS domain-containing protein [Candidatus Omnitrophota bacterium]
MTDKIKKILKESVDVKRKLIEKDLSSIADLAQTIIGAIKSGNKVLIFGNGGSASDSIHMAAELVGRFKKERKAVPVIALPANISIITSIGNDYGFEKIFERQIEALGKKGDIALGITTSGRSKNVLNGLAQAKKLGLKTASLVGDHVKDISGLSDIVISVDSSNTPRIQESHVTIIHIICELIEDAL